MLLDLYQRVCLNLLPVPFLARLVVQLQIEHKDGHCRLVEAKIVEKVDSQKPITLSSKLVRPRACAWQIIQRYSVIEPKGASALVQECLDFTLCFF